MAVEMTMLVWSVILGLVQLVLSVLFSVGGRGLMWAVGPRDETPELSSPVGKRVDRAYRNFLETFPLFAALVLAVVAMGRGDSHTALGAELYFWGRVAFVPLYALGVPWLRTLAWTVALVGMLMLLAALF